MAGDAAAPRELRATAAGVGWTSAGGTYVLERMPGGARLITRDGECVELGEADWRALQQAIARLFPAPAAPPAETPQQARTGRAWTAAMDAHLAARWTAGETLARLAASLGRSAGAIAARLVRLGLVESRQHARLLADGSVGAPGNGPEPFEST